MNNVPRTLAPIASILTSISNILPTMTYSGNSKQNYLYNLFNSIILFILSILKILAGNHLIVLVVAITLLYSIKFLNDRKLILPCFNCSNGSWWYKCAKNTGFGSDTCKTYNKVLGFYEEIGTAILNIPNHALKFLYIGINHSNKITRKGLHFFDKLVLILIYINPVNLIGKHLISLIYKIFDNLDEFANLLDDNMTCAFTLPIIDIEIDICNYIIAPIKYFILFVKVIISSMIKIIYKVFKIIYKFISKILNLFVKAIFTSFRFITKNIFKIFSEVTLLTDIIQKPFAILFEIPATQYLSLLINTLINYIINIIPYGNLLKDFPNIVLIIILMPIILSIFGAILGAIIGLYSLAKSLLYIFMGIEDDTDFYIIILSIIQYFYDIILKLIDFLQESYNNYVENMNKLYKK